MKNYFELRTKIQAISWQQSCWTSHLAIVRPTTSLVTTFANHLLNFYNKGFMFLNYKETYFSSQKGIFTQEITSSHFCL